MGSPSGLMASTVIDSKVIVSKWVHNSLSFLMLHPQLVHLVLSRRSLLLDRKRDVGFSLFLALPSSRVCLRVGMTNFGLFRNSGT